MSHEIETIELTIEQAKKSVELKTHMESLRNNPDFIAVIENELLDNYARNTVYLLSDPNMQEPEVQADLIKDLEMIGRVRQFFSSIFQKGFQAEKSIKDSENAIDELRAEGVED